MSTYTPKALFFHSKLSGSENHRGFVIRDENNNHLGDVMPMDEDGIGGKALVERIADSYNALADRDPSKLADLEKAVAGAAAWLRLAAHRGVGICIGQPTEEDLFQAERDVRAALAAFRKEAP